MNTVDPAGATMSPEIDAVPGANSCTLASSFVCPAVTRTAVTLPKPV